MQHTANDKSRIARVARNTQPKLSNKQQGKEQHSKQKHERRPVEACSELARPMETRFIPPEFMEIQFKQPKPAEAQFKNYSNLWEPARVCTNPDRTNSAHAGRLNPTDLNYPCFPRPNRPWQHRPLWPEVT